MSKKEREVIDLEDYATNKNYPNAENLHIDDWDTVKVISTKQIGFDPEKRFAEKETVIQRLSDDKFFKFTYTEFAHSETNILEQTAEQVFPKTITKVIYE